MLETIIGRLVVSGVAGLAYIAYQHPDTFPRLMFTLFLATLAGMGLLVSFSEGKKAGAREAFEFIRGGGSADAFTIDPGLNTPTTGLIVLAFILYLIFLLILPMIVGSAGSGKK